MTITQKPIHQVDEPIGDDAGQHPRYRGYFTNSFVRDGARILLIHIQVPQLSDRLL